MASCVQPPCMNSLPELSRLTKELPLSADASASVGRHPAGDPPDVWVTLAVPGTNG
jgi:hypothetical protein